MRPIPEFKNEYGVSDNAPARDGYVSMTREYELITPLFGGGVEPGAADPVTIIRATEIRGHLRFWWRATRGGQFDGDMELMKQYEDNLWGAAISGETGSPSQVILQTVTTNRGRRFITRNHKGEEVGVFDLNSPFGYAAFPLRDRRQGVIEGVKFTMCIQYPSSAKAEIEAALWAWETFGGIGGRTRRGFGAVRLVAVNKLSQALPDANRIGQLIAQNLIEHCPQGKIPPDLPFLSRDARDFVITAPLASPIEAWKYLINRLKEFRQRRNPGNQQNRPGRSQWPEPDAIRRLTKKAAARHKQPFSWLDVFPRAEFGLPIVFKFKDDNQGDPPVTTLEGADEREKRLASPLILRPLVCANNRAVGLAMVLDTPRTPPGGLMLSGAPGDPIVTSSLAELSDSELDSIKPLNGGEDARDDILAAFLDTL